MCFYRGLICGFRYGREMVMSNHKCSHEWDKIRESLHWCKKCGSIKDQARSYMSGNIVGKITLPEIYKNYLRGILSYGR